MKKSYSELSKNEPVCICKEGWCVGLGELRGCLRKGVLSEIPFKNFKKGEASWVTGWVP